MIINAGIAVKVIWFLPLGAHINLLTVTILIGHNITARELGCACGHADSQKLYSIIGCLRLSIVRASAPVNYSVCRLDSVA